MTAASGLVHQEYHGKEFSEKGGRFEMVQLWVNLPKKFKMSPPRYQGIINSKIPVVNFENGSGHLRVVAGQYADVQGPTKTFSAINLWDLRLKAGAKIDLKVPAGHTSTLFVLSGQTKVSETHKLADAELAVFEQSGDTISLYAREDTKLLYLGGEPLNEPIVGYGPFVMNTQAEISQAMSDYEAGKMGFISNVKGSD
jgi:redox-sensitive bicupin YhaK (pirin superfamily)